MSGHLVVMRHGATQFNQDGLVMGRRDEPLSRTGRAQAARAAERLAPLSIARVWASPLARAVDTARIATADRDLPLCLRPDLEERGWGEWEGRPRRDRPAGCRAPAGGESLSAFHDRVAAVFAAAQSAPAPLLLVTHSGVLRRMFEVAGLQPDPFLGHCDPVMLARDGAGRWRAQPAPNDRQPPGQRDGTP